MSIIVVVPVYRRPHRIQTLVQSLEQSGAKAKLLFVASPEDREELTALEGIERRIEPPEPLATTDDVTAGATLPIDWKLAIEAFERSESMSRIFAPILRESFVGMKKQEVQVFSRQISAFEHETYLETV